MDARPRVLVSVSFAAHEYQRMQIERAREAAGRCGLEVEVADCNRDAALQVKQIEAAIRSPEHRPVAVVILPKATAGLEGVGRAALDLGVGWVLTEPAFFMERLARAYPGKLAAVVAADDREIGRLQARVFRALLPAGGGVLYVEGPSLTTAVIARRQGVDEVLKGSRVQIVKTLVGDWSEESAERAATEWLRSGRAVRPALVGGQNETLALGVRKAFQALRPEWLDVPFTGCDGTASGARLVREGILAATVVQPTTMGQAVELVARSLRREATPALTTVPPSVIPPLAQLELRAASGAPAAP